MKAAFTNELRTDTSTPMWLEKAQISTWLADQHKTEKDRRKKANAEQPAKSDGGEAGNDERPAKKAKAASKALPAAAKPKVAPEAAPKAAPTKPTASDATKQATKQPNRQSNKQGSKAGAPKRKATAGRGSNKKKKNSTPLYIILHARAICGHKIAGNTRGVINETLLACLRSFLGP